MSDDLYEVWRDDHLIDAAARGDLLEIADDPAAGPLIALSVLADARPLPRLDIDRTGLVDSRHNRRYAVRSLAVAVSVVATLSTSGVAAVVTGDPFRPAKAVWHQIQDHTGLRTDSDEVKADSGSALGAPTVEPQLADASKPTDMAVAGVPSAQGLTARAPVSPSVQAADDPAATDGEQSYGAEDPAEEQSSQQAYAEDDTQPSAEQDPAQEPADPEQQDPNDDTGSEPAPDDGSQPAPDEQSDDNGLDDLVLPGAPGQVGDDSSSQPAPTERTRPEDGYADHEQVLSRPTTEPRNQPLSQPLSDNVQGTVDGTATDNPTSDPTDTPTDYGTPSPPPTLAP